MTEITDETPMPFGRYKDKKKMIEVPAAYLLWLHNEGCQHAGVKRYILDNLEVLKKEAAKATRYRK